MIRRRRRTAADFGHYQARRYQARAKSRAVTSGSIMRANDGGRCRSSSRLRMQWPSRAPLTDRGLPPAAIRGCNPVSRADRSRTRIAHGQQCRHEPLRAAEADPGRQPQAGVPRCVLPVGGKIRRRLRPDRSRARGAGRGATSTRSTPWACTGCCCGRSRSCTRCRSPITSRPFAENRCRSHSPAPPAMRPASPPGPMRHRRRRRSASMAASNGCGRNSTPATPTR